VSLLVQAEALVELGDTTAGIHQLLLAGEEGVTLRADFYANIILRRTCLNYITAGAFNSSLLIIGMDSFLHCSCSPLSGTLVLFTKATEIIPQLFPKCKHYFKIFSQISQHLPFHFVLSAESGGVAPPEAFFSIASWMKFITFILSFVDSTVIA
jgi:hypothetical protein